MKIVADADIPFVADYFHQCGEIQLISGRNITKKDLIDADILLVRSITRVDQALLENTTIKCVGTVTSGLDHIDIAWLASQGITLISAEGFNSQPVVEYVLSAIAALHRQQLLPLQSPRAAVIGVGKIGERVVQQLRRLNFEVLQYDPLRAMQDPYFISATWEEINNVDIISIHAPLTDDGLNPTYHLIEKNFLQRQKKGCILLNTARGAIINFQDLKQYGRHLYWCFDVWENEPHIDFSILESALIATPHIAGYSVQSRYRGIDMVYKQIHQLFFYGMDELQAEFPTQYYTTDKMEITWQDVMLDLFDPLSFTHKMQTALINSGNNPEVFDEMRRNFTERYELAYLHIEKSSIVPGDPVLIMPVETIVDQQEPEQEQGFYNE